VLLGLAATASGLLWARVDDAATRRIAAEYAEPLATWCLIALATNVAAVVAAGDAGVGSLALPVLLGLAAGLLRYGGGRLAPAAPAPRPAAPATAAEAPAAARRGRGGSADTRSTMAISSSTSRR
jgi:hypothetical protein